MNAKYLLLLIAVVLWFFSGVIGLWSAGNGPAYRVHLGWLGMFFYGLSLLVH